VTINRRNFLKLGSLFVPAVAAHTVVYSFIWNARGVHVIERDQLADFDFDAHMREFDRRMAAAVQVPEHMLFGQPGAIAAVTLRGQLGPGPCTVLTRVAGGWEVRS
jgi:hypothetical protein